MILRVLTLCCLLLIPAEPRKQASQRCLTGYMTDVQDWVDESGVLKPGPGEIEFAVDLSSNMFPVPVLQQMLSEFTYSSRSYIKFLSLARCHLNRIPPIFVLRDTKNRGLSETVEYVTFYGNSFLGMNSAEQYEMIFNATDTVDMNLADPFHSETTNVWSTGLTSVTFPNLKELDLRACSIQTLGENLFTGMPSLTALYLGENEISFIASTAFFGLHNLRHLDFSRNRAFDDDGKPKNLASDSYFMLRGLTKLVSLDLSFTKMTQRNLGMICRLRRSFKSLSLCETGLTSLMDGIFNTTSLQILDISGNSGILTFHNALRGVEKSLKVLNAREIGLQTMDIFQNFSKLEILQLSHNEIGNVKERVVQSMRNLKILDLNNNRLPAGFEATFSLVPTLKFLLLRNNNINIISEEMIQDIINVDYLALSGNFIVCNCHAKDLYKMAYRNQKLFQNKPIKVPKHQMYHNGYTIYNQIIHKRQNMDLDCDERCLSDIDDSGRFRLVDYNPSSYVCLKIPESRSVAIATVTSCKKAKRDMDYESELANSRLALLSLLFIPAVLVPVAVLFILRRQIRYCFITMRNSATLSLINKNETIVDGTVFNYDVFVSYCNEDRGWVLDHLLPQIEAECSISACLHERDFQVGLSILENIVSCMDRSRSIMLIISQRFLLSQWCQFEMHLAQHRLVETRREGLTLVLLEEIPRRLRPNTLHYLMLTKTYIVWSKDESERNVFWRRLKKTLISQKTKQTEKVSLA